VAIPFCPEKSEENGFPYGERSTVAIPFCPEKSEEMVSRLEEPYFLNRLVPHAQYQVIG
jgi:hypothetical protein